ncbi:MAG: L,D-transpeptidase family protein [Halorhodospira sp.]
MKTLLPGLLLLLLALRSLVTAQAGPPQELPFDPGQDERWVLVDTEAYNVTVYSGEQPLVQLENPAIGRYGTAATRRRGDRTTPTGVFRINRIHEESEYHLFLGLDYPRLRHARRARDDGTISRSEYLAYLDAFAHRGGPPQETALGGHIGIHGLGELNVHVHRRINWTDGCVALENEQIETLAELVDIGTRVYIR